VKRPPNLKLMPKPVMPAAPAPVPTGGASGFSGGPGQPGGTAVGGDAAKGGSKWDETPKPASKQPEMGESDVK